MVWITFFKTLAIVALVSSWLYYFNVQRRYRIAKSEFQEIHESLQHPDCQTSWRKHSYARQWLSRTRNEWEQAWRVPYHGVVLAILLWFLAATRKSFLRRQAVAEIESNS